MRCNLELLPIWCIKDAEPPGGTSALLVGYRPGIGIGCRALDIVGPCFHHALECFVRQVQCQWKRNNTGGS